VVVTAVVFLLTNTFDLVPPADDVLSAGGVGSAGFVVTKQTQINNWRVGRVVVRTLVIKGY